MVDSEKLKRWLDIARWCQMDTVGWFDISAPEILGALGDDPDAIDRYIRECDDPDMVCLLASYDEEIIEAFGDRGENMMTILDEKWESNGGAKFQNDDSFEMVGGERIHEYAVAEEAWKHRGSPTRN